MKARANFPVTTTGGTVMGGRPAPALDARTVRGAHVSATPPLVEALAGLIDAHGTLYDWAANQPQPRALRGRAPVYVAHITAAHETVVVRHAWHGGLFAPITGDRFRGTRRASREFLTSAMLRDLGVPTTEVLGFASYPATCGLRRVDVVSRFLPDAFDLGLILAGLVPGMMREDALAATGVLLTRLAVAGVVHPDLNVKNVLVRREVDGTLTALIIDVDVVRMQPPLMAAHTMQANLSRLVRSMRKWRSRFGCDLPDARLDQFSRTALDMIVSSTTVSSASVSSASP